MRSLFSALGLLPVIASAQFARVISIGDSLSDGGNLSAFTGGAFPGAGYSGGRYSNGPLWNERLASLTGLPLAPSLGGGGNFAWASAATGPGATSPTTGVPTLVAQYASALSAGAFTPGTLVTVWGGANDLSNAIPPTEAADRVATIAAGARAAGASMVIVPNLVDLGLIPRFRGTAQQAAVTAATDAYNARLASVLASAADPNVRLLDVNSLFDDVLANPSAYGFTNATGQGINATGGADFVFWDESHPTAKAHAIIGDRAYALAVPEPASIAVLGFGLAAIRRRRRG